MDLGNVVNASPEAALSAAHSDTDDTTFDDGCGQGDFSDGDDDAVWPNEVRGRDVRSMFFKDDFVAEGLIKAEQQVAQVELKYATVAKRVDVAQLKRDVWADLQAQHELTQTRADKHLLERRDSSEEQGTNSCSFKKTIQTLTDRVSSNITVPFFFICTLHLANEKGLALTGTHDLS